MVRTRVRGCIRGDGARNPRGAWATSLCLALPPPIAVRPLPALRRSAWTARCLAALCALSACGGGGSSGDGGGDGPPSDGGGQPAYVSISAPLPRKGARFGETMCALDFDGDGTLELAIGAPGEGAVYLAEAVPGDPPTWVVVGLVNAAGQDHWPVAKALDHFGAALAPAQLDDDPADELVVGASQTAGVEGGEEAGAVFVFGLRDTFADPVRFDSPWGAGSRYGQGVATGDFDLDGLVDLAVGAPWVHDAHERSGAIQVLLGPLAMSAEQTQSLIVPNPNSSTEGNFGLHLAPQEAANGHTLVATAIGNDSFGGERLAGQVFVFPPPLAADAWEVLEDPTPAEDDPPRFGMSLDARGRLVAIGAPRKDIGGLTDSGMGFVFEEGGPAYTFVHEHPMDEDILGFRCAFADVVGDAAPDYLFLSLRRRSLYVWSSEDPRGKPVLAVEAPDDAGDHHGMGIGAAQVVPGGREEVFVGDPTYDRPEHGLYDDVGRAGVLVFGD